MRESHKLHSAIRAEIEDLNRELSSVQPLFAKLAIFEPNAIEIRAVAATLHAFYNGIERILLLISKHIDEVVPVSATWHRDLLNAMAGPTDGRSPIISPTVRDELSEYLGFRHFFRHAYPMRLSWPLVKPLVEKLETVRNVFCEEIELFLAKDTR